MKRVIALLLLAAMLTACETPREQFERRIDRILEPCDATVGVAVLAPDGTPITRNDRPLPMLSVFKFPVALAVLDRTTTPNPPFCCRTLPLPNQRGHQRRRHSRQLE